MSGMWIIVLFLLDLKILLLTVVKVLKSEGVSQDRHVTAEKFTGRRNAWMQNVVIIGAGGHGKVRSGTCKRAAGYGACRYS